MAPRTPEIPQIAHERCIDDPRPMKVVCIGAGMSGIAIGCLLPQHIPNIELVIYDKNEDVGGTWYENHYPGVRPDLTPHVYQYTFANNPNWTRFYPPGEEFEAYLKAVATKFGVYNHFKGGYRFLKASWIEEDGQWEITMQKVEDQTIFTERTDVLIKAIGLVNDWQWPNIPGREKFVGTMLHTANWDDSFDPAGKNVAVLGYGSTGVQITPAIQPIVKHLDHYVRGRVWVPPGGGTNGEELAERDAKFNFDHSLEERQHFSKNPQAYLQFRKKLEISVNAPQGIFQVGSEAQKKFEAFLDHSLKKNTKRKPWLYDALKPDYPPGCRRLIMGQAWLECAQEDNMDIIFKGAREFTEKGIIDIDGTERSYDAIICATGFNVSMNNAGTPIYGRNGTSLGDLWKDRPTAYVSVNPEAMPNLFLMFGPNAAPFAGSIIHTFEASALYIIKCIQKMQREYIKSMVCKPHALQSWVKHVDRHMGKTTLSDNCVTWFKRNDPKGPVVALWPGSSLASYKGWAEPRWEDYEYTSWLPEGDAMAWIGNGYTVKEKIGKEDTADEYLDVTDISSILHVPSTDFAAPLKVSQDTSIGNRPPEATTPTTA